MSLPDRYWAKVDKSGPCWIWTGAHTRDGYGSFAVGNRRSALAHRLSYTDALGPIPDGLQLDHLCRVRDCVNPQHLEPVTNRQNALRGVSFSAQNAKKTECVNGHQFTPDNTYIYERNGNMVRSCRACQRKSVARYKGAGSTR